MTALLALLLAAAPDASKLNEAKRLLAAGQLDEVLFTLEGELPKAEREDAAHVMAEAARQAQENDDLILCLQFVQMALRHSPKNVLALEVGARASQKAKQLDPAERYADAWVALEPKRGEPKLLRAEISLEQGEWLKAAEAVADIDPAKLSSTERSRLQHVLSTTRKELSERQAGLAEAKAMNARLWSQMERMAKAPKTPARPIARAAGEVLLYSTSWCGYCKKAAAWLRKRGVPFVEKDIETDPEAAEELAEKQRRAGRRGGGVPWIDVRGELVSGFDESALERLLP